MTVAEEVRSAITSLESRDWTKAVSFVFLLSCVEYVIQGKR